ncbi:MAG: hypothetical protein ABIG56_02260 [Candidatus Omnitrophota bacterium]
MKEIFNKLKLGGLKLDKLDLSKLGLSKIKLDKAQLEKLNFFKVKFDRLNLDNKKIILVFLVFGFLVYADISYILKGQLNGIKAGKPRIEKLQKDLDGLVANLNKMKRLEQGQAVVKGKAQRVKEFISGDELVGLLQNISLIARKNNVQILQMNPSGEKQVSKAEAANLKNLKPVLIKLNLTCGYHHLGSFINQLENGAFFMAAESFKISPQQLDFNMQKVSLVLLTYVKK